MDTINPTPLLMLNMQNKSHQMSNFENFCTLRTKPISYTDVTSIHKEHEAEDLQKLMGNRDSKTTIVRHILTATG